MALTAILAICLSGCKKAATPAPDDASMSAALRSRLAADSALNSEAILPSVESGVATLSGFVSSEAARSLAAADAAQVSGIRTVVNNLMVQPQVTSSLGPPPPPPPPNPVKAPTKPVAKVVPPPVAPPPPPAPIERAAPVQQAQETPAPAPLPPAPVPTAPPAPEFRKVTIPADTIIPIRITQTLDSATTQQGESFSGTIATDIIIDGLVAIRQGTSVSGRVDQVQEAAHYKGSSLLSIELTGINLRGQTLSISTEPYSVQGKGRGANTAEKVGGGAAVGAILGGIFGGGKGAAIGAAAGGGVGAGANTITRGEQVSDPL